MNPLAAWDRAEPFIREGALVVVNHSGGKDSQATLALLAPLVPREQLVVVHAVLPDVEWPGTREHAERQARGLGVAFHGVQAGKTLLEMVQHNGNTRPEAPAWPSPATRQCTSDLKTSPIKALVGKLLAARGGGVVISAMGLRAEESSARAKREPWAFNDDRSSDRAFGRKGNVRRWFDWLPIHPLSTAQVFDVIRAAGEEPHWAYAAGNTRLSCMYCIMGSAADARNAAVHNPWLLAAYAELERRTGYVMSPAKGRPNIEALVGMTVAEAFAAHAALPAEQRARMAGAERLVIPAETLRLRSRARTEAT